MLDAKRRVRSSGIQVYLFEMLDGREARASGQFVLECFDTLRWAFGHRFNSSVIEVLHITDHLMPRRRALREETKANALYVAGQ